MMHAADLKLLQIARIIVMPLFSPPHNQIIICIIILQLSGSLGKRKLFALALARWVGFCQSRCGKAHVSRFSDSTIILPIPS